MKGVRFITLEGIEGVGKSTHVEFIKRYLKRSDHPVVVTREPGGTPLGESVRNILLHGKALSISAETELLLMFAARAQHLEEVIRPALEQGAVVVCDRFTDASYAYQGGGRGISRDYIETLEHLVLRGMRPDLTLLFDASIETGLQRAGKRGNADRFEIEDLDFFNRTRDAYLARARKEPDRVKLVDAEQSVADVEASIAAILEEHS